MSRGGVVLLVVALTVGVAARASGVERTGAVSRPVAPAAHRVLTPPVHAAVSYQLGGAFAPAPGVAIVDRDRLATPAAGYYNICYVNAFQAQPGALGWWRARHRRLLLARSGHAIVDRGWHEQLLDTSTPFKRRALARIVGGWIESCARAGFHAVELDNLDSWDRSQRALTRADNLAFAALLIARAHALGMAVAQKNAAEVAPQGRRMGFDFAVAEECQPNRECDSYLRAYGLKVIEIEYPDHGGLQTFAAACRARGDRISIVYRDRAVTPAGQVGFIERRCNQAER